MSTEPNLVSDQKPASKFDPRLRTEKPVRPPTIPRDALDARRLSQLAEGFRGHFPGSLATVRVVWGSRQPLSRQGIHSASLVRYLPRRRQVELHPLLALQATPGDVLAAFVFLGLLMAYSGKDEPYEHPETVRWIEEQMELFCPASEFLALFIENFWVWLGAVGGQGASRPTSPS